MIILVCPCQAPTYSVSSARIENTVIGNEFETREATQASPDHQIQMTSIDINLHAITWLKLTQQHRPTCDIHHRPMAGGRTTSPALTCLRYIICEALQRTLRELSGQEWAHDETRR